MKHWMLPVLFAIATGCTTDDVTASTDQPLASCSLPPPGKAGLSRLAFDGRIVARTALPPTDRYHLDLVLAHGTVYGDGDWDCEFHDHGGAGHSVICTNEKTGVTCGFHNWSDGPEVGCDDPDHPTC